MPDTPDESTEQAPAPALPAEDLAEAPKPSGGPAPEWEHRALYDNVLKTLFALPAEFQSSLFIRDFRATDIFTLNSALGASIEDAVVLGLNKLKDLWDPTGKYALYRFERQSQAFPDVRLVSDAPDKESPLMGIELKGWFAMAKEGVPTFRYNINPDCCAPQDLVAVFPWVLSDVIAGSPKLLPPYVGEARQAAEYRNYYWRTMRQREGGDPTIISAEHRQPYPMSKVDKCSDVAAVDSGDNFGRIARSGLLNSFIKATGKQLASGIPVKAWVAFFSVFKDSTSGADELAAVVERALANYAVKSDEDRQALVAAVELLLSKLKSAPMAATPAATRPRNGRTKPTGTA